MPSFIKKINSINIKLTAILQIKGNRKSS